MPELLARSQKAWTLSKSSVLPQALTFNTRCPSGEQTVPKSRGPIESLPRPAAVKFVLPARPGREDPFHRQNRFTNGGEPEPQWRGVRPSRTSGKPPGFPSAHTCPIKTSALGQKDRMALCALTFERAASKQLLTDPYLLFYLFSLSSAQEAGAAFKPLVVKESWVVCGRPLSSRIAVPQRDQ